MCTQRRGSEHVRRIVTHLSGEEHAMNSSMLNIILVIICVLWYQVRGFSEAILTRCFLYYLEMPVNHLCVTNCPKTSWFKYLQAFILLSSLQSRESVAWRPYLCCAPRCWRVSSKAALSLVGCVSSAIKERALVLQPWFPSSVA